MTDSLVWISGATRGIGCALARTIPYRNARIISLSREAHPDFETVRFDLTDPESYESVGAHFTKELAAFRGTRTIFIQCARYAGRRESVFDSSPDEQHRALQANVVAPLVLGGMYLGAVRNTHESGLVFISSPAAKYCCPGRATYCAAKAATEMWVNVVGRELMLGKPGAWVAAVRPGVADSQITSGLTADSQKTGKPVESKPLAALDRAAMDIWASLPPRPEAFVVSFDYLVDS